MTKNMTPERDPHRIKTPEEQRRLDRNAMAAVAYLKRTNNEDVIPILGLDDSDKTE